MNGCNNWFQCFTVFVMLLQVQDYRKCASEPGSGSQPTDGCPIVNKVCLRMSLENVVKDIPLISDSSWTYGDLMVSVFHLRHPLQINVMLWFTDAF